MGSNYKLTYGVDLVFCIDVTMSMDHILDTVKKNALRFYQDFQVIMKNKHKNVSELRIRIIAFRDYYYDREQAMLVTDFFHLPDQAYGVDLVFCIDVTMSMDHILDTVKKNALRFYQDFQVIMKNKHKNVSELRIRIIAFRDYYYDREQAMLVTDFFHLPDQAADFKACLTSIEASGGGDDEEDGLEALAYAMKSKWNMTAQKRRHVIVVWSDDGTHDLGFGKSAPNYPANMAADFNELTRWWGSRTSPGVMDESAKRLIIFAPNKKSWNKITDNWNNVIQYESEAGDGLADCDYEQILSAIGNSI